MTNDKTEAAEMEKLIEMLSPMQCDCDDEHTDSCHSFGRIYEYIRTLQSRNTVLEEDWKRMREALQTYRKAIICSKCVINEGNHTPACEALRSLHHSPDSV